MVAKWFRQVREANQSRQVEAMMATAGRNFTTGIDNIGRHVRFQTPAAGAALDLLASASSPEAIGRSAEEVFLREQEFLDGLGEGDRRQGAFMYYALCMETAKESAFRLIADHRRAHDLEPEPTIRFRDRASAAWRNSSDFDHDAWAVGLDPHRAEVNSLVAWLEEELSTP